MGMVWDSPPTRQQAAVEALREKTTHEKLQETELMYRSQ
jgi:hypothetical protein